MNRSSPLGPERGPSSSKTHRHQVHEPHLCSVTKEEGEVWVSSQYCLPDHWTEDQSCVTSCCVVGRALCSTNKTYILSMNTFTPGACLARAHDFQHSPVWFPSTVLLWEIKLTLDGAKLFIPPIFQDGIFKTWLFSLTGTKRKGSAPVSPACSWELIYQCNAFFLVANALAYSPWVILRNYALQMNEWILLSKCINDWGGNNLHTLCNSKRNSNIILIHLEV